MLSRIFRLSLLFCLVALAASCTQRPGLYGIPEGRILITFNAMGDVPYEPKEEALLARQLQELDADAEFVIHVGDIRHGSKGPPCEEGPYAHVASILRKSPKPLFIIPGDNEYNDCPNVEQAWEFWVKYFMRFEEHWRHGLAVHRQPNRPENFAFIHNQVVFVGLNIVGGRIQDPAEWKRRHAEDLAWTAQWLRDARPDVKAAVIFGHATPTPNHAAYFDGLSAAAGEFNKPILYLHGDGHKWTYDHPFTANNILRIQVDNGGIAPPIRVEVRDSREAFVIDRRLTTASPKSTTRP